MRTKLVIAILLLVVAVAAAVAWREYRKVCCAEAPTEAVVAPDDPDVDPSGKPEPVWSDAEQPVVDASPEGLYNDLKAASEDAHQKPSLEIERVPPPALPPPTRGEDDDPA